MPTSFYALRLDPAGRLNLALAALQRQRVPGTERAAHSLAHFLTGYGQTESDWAGSPLTADGFPCELTFGSGTPCVRYAVEPAATSARNRLNVCEQLLAEVGAPDLPEVIRNRILALHQAGALSYGAWIGASHNAAGDRYKLYVEVPPSGAKEACARLLADYLGHSGPHLRYPLRMLGYDPAGGLLEFYFRAEDGLPAELPQAADGELALLINTAPHQVSGFSLALAPNGHVTAYSQYIFANQVFGPDAQLRRRLLNQAHRHGWALPGYAAVSSPAATHSDSCQHGLLAWVSRPNGPSEIRLGLTPPRLAARFTAVPSQQEYCNA